MDDCIFCKVVKGELPSYTIFEDENFFALLDIHPVSKGHTLVIPKKHYLWTYDVPDFGSYFEVAKRIGNAIRKGLQAPWVQFFTHGQIPHAHIHVVPRYDDIQKGRILPSWDDPKTLEKKEFEEIAEKIKTSL